MQPWIIFSLLSAVFAALVAIFAKLGLSQVDSTLATTLRAGVMAIFLGILSLALNKYSQLSAIDNKALTFIVLSGLAGASSWLFYFLALKTGPTTSVASIDKLSIVFVFILSFLVLKEPLTVKSIIGVILIVAGTFLTIK